MQSQIAYFYLPLGPKIDDRCLIKKNVVEIPDKIERNRKHILTKQRLIMIETKMFYFSRFYFAQTIKTKLNLGDLSMSPAKAPPVSISVGEGTALG